MTVTKLAVNCSIDIIAGMSIKTDEFLLKLSDPENTSCSELGRVMPCLSGKSSETRAGKSESTALSSATRASTGAVTLSDRLTPLLISAGLVCGIIPLSMRDGSSQLTLDAVLRRQVGKNAEPRNPEG